MINLAMIYMSQGRRKEAKQLQIEAVNLLLTTLGDDHSSTVIAITTLASFREECTSPVPFRGMSDLMEHLRDRILQFATSWPLDQGKGGQERLESLPMMDGGGGGGIRSFQATSIELDESNETDEERLRHELAISVMGGNDNDEIGSFQAAPTKPSEANEIDEEWLQREPAMLTTDGNDKGEIGSPLATPIESDEGNETDEEWLRHALAMSMIDRNDNDEIGSFQAASIEPDKCNEVNEERLLRALATSMMDENGGEDLVSLKEDICLIYS